MRNNIAMNGVKSSIEKTVFGNTLCTKLYSGSVRVTTNFPGGESFDIPNHDITTRITMSSVRKSAIFRMK